MTIVLLFRKAKTQPLYELLKGYKKFSADNNFRFQKWKLSRPSEPGRSVIPWHRRYVMAQFYDGTLMVREADAA